jgi:hypothetical protein
MDVEIFPECSFSLGSIIFFCVVSSDCLWHHVRFAGHEPFEGFNILGEVDIDALHTLLRTATLMTPH